MEQFKSGNLGRIG